MPDAVVDTGVLIGRADESDHHHELATGIVRGMDHGELPTGRVTNYVVLETLNWISERKRHETAVDVFERLKGSAGFEIHQAARKDFGRAVEYFETYEGLSFGDATIVAYMEREELEYLYAFDGDFDVIEWINRLETPDDPRR